MVFSFFIAWLRQAQPPYYSRCLSGVEGRSDIFTLVISTGSITVLYLLLLSVPEPVEGTFSIILPVISTSSITVLFTTNPGAWACRRHILTHTPGDLGSAQSPFYLLLLSAHEPVEGTFSLIISVISAPLNNRVISIKNPMAQCGLTYTEFN